MARAATIATVLTGLFFAYNVYLALLIPDNFALVVNLVVAPGIVGAIAYRCLHNAPKTIAWLWITPVLIPLPTTLYFGGDPSKPGLEWLLYYGLVMFVVLGEAAAWLVRWLINRRKDVQHVQA